MDNCCKVLALENRLKGAAAALPFSLDSFGGPRMDEVQRWSVSVP